MKQNQLRGSEIPLQPWGSEQQSLYKTRQPKNRPIQSPPKRNHSSSSKRPNSQMKYIKNNNNFYKNQHRFNVSNNLREHYQQALSTLNQSQIESNFKQISSNYQHNMAEPKINPVGMKYYMRNLYSKVPLTKTNIQYFDDLKVRNRDNRRSAGKSRKSIICQNQNYLTARPATSLSFFHQNKSGQRSLSRTIRSQIHGKTISCLSNYQNQQKQHRKYQKNQFQTVLKIKQRLRQRNKIHSKKKDEEREMNTRQKNRNIQKNPQEDFNTSDFQVTIQTIRPQDGQIQYMSNFQNSPICHERNIKMMKYRKKRKSVGIKYPTFSQINFTN